MHADRIRSSEERSQHAVFLDDRRQGPTNSHTTQPKAALTILIRCPISGCAATRKRKADMDRHLRKAHAEHSSTNHGSMRYSLRDFFF